MSLDDIQDLKIKIPNGKSIEIDLIKKCLQIARKLRPQIQDLK